MYFPFGKCKLSTACNVRRLAPSPGKGKSLQEKKMFKKKTTLYHFVQGYIIIISAELGHMSCCLFES